MVNKLSLSCYVIFKVLYYVRCGIIFMGNILLIKDVCIVKKLRDGGVIFIGFFNMYELGIGIIGNNFNR